MVFINDTQEILIQDARIALMKSLENKEGMSDLDESFVSWLLSDSHLESKLKISGEKSAVRNGASRTYSDVAILGYCVDAGLIETNIISALKDGLEWLSGRSIMVHGISTGLSQDPIALLGIALGTRTISDDRLTNIVLDWFNSFIFDAYKMRGIKDWQKCLIASVAQVLQTKEEIPFPSNTSIDDVLIALASRKVISLNDKADKELTALHHLKKGNNVDDEPIRSALSLVACNEIMNNNYEISTPREQNNMNTENKKIKILFLAASPTNEAQLKLDVEHREISEKLRQSKYRDTFELESQWAVRTSDITKHLMQSQPDIVHFSGHGSKNHEIILLDQNNKSHPVSAEKLNQLFSILKDNIRCVVLNACYSEGQANSIANHIDCVLGMSDAIGDNSAIIFAANFYQALAYGRSIGEAFKLGCLQIDMENLNEEATPKLICNKDNADEIYLLGR